MVNTGFLPVPPDKGGSIEMHTYYLSNELAKLGVEVHYVTSVNYYASFHKRVSLYKLPRIPFNFHGNYLQTLLGFEIGGFFSFLQALRAINQSKYDIIHLHGQVPAFHMVPLKKKSLFIFTVHNPNPWMVKSFSSLKQAFRQLTFKSIELTIINHADCVITVGECLRDELINRFNICPEKIKVIPNGVDTNVFRPDIENSKKVLTKYKLPENYALFVGRLVEQKGLHYLLRAINGTKIPVVIVGSGSLLPYLRRLCFNLGISKQVYFIGSVPLHELRKIYSLARLFVLPSVAEGFPVGLVGLEAMASGLPLIVPRIKGVESIVHEGYNGVLFNVGDIKSLRDKLIWLFENEDVAKIMGRRSRIIAKRKFSWTSIAKKTLQLYDDLIKRRAC